MGNKVVPLGYQLAREIKLLIENSVEKVGGAVRQCG
jgi:hypothetical protein